MGSRRRPSRRFVVAGVMLLVVAAAGVASVVAATGKGGKRTGHPVPTSSPTPTTVNFTATITLDDNVGDTLSNPYIGHAFTTTGATCKGRGVDAEFAAGHTVELRAADGTVVASVDLGNGTFQRAANGEPAQCVFTVAYTDVPSDLDLFKLDLAGHGGPTFHNADMYRDGVGLIFNSPTK